MIFDIVIPLGPNELYIIHENIIRIYNKVSYTSIKLDLMVSVYIIYMNLFV